MLGMPCVKRLKEEQGFTLIELLVVIALTGILVIASFYFVDSLYNADLRSSQEANERAGLNKTSEYLSLALGEAVVGTLGQPCGTSASTACPDVPSASAFSIIPTSIASDQIIFTSNQTCYRIYYNGVADPHVPNRQMEDIYVATAPFCSGIAPAGGVAGPNTGGTDPQTQNDPLFETGTTLVAQPLFNAAGAPQELSVINYTTPLSSDSFLYNMFQRECPGAIPSDVPVFTFLNANGNILCPPGGGPDDGASMQNFNSSQSMNAWYSNVSYGNGNGNNAITSILVTLYVQVQNDPTSPQLTSQETIDLGQPSSYAPINNAPPVITDSTSLGSWSVGDTVTSCATAGSNNCAGTWDWGTTDPVLQGYSYQWERCSSSGESCTDISGGSPQIFYPGSLSSPNCANVSSATSCSYTISSNDVGSTLRLVVTAKSVYGNVEAISAATGVVG